MKIGDLVKVSYHSNRIEDCANFVSIVLEVNKSDHHPNGLGLVKVLELGQESWYPIGYIEVISEAG